MRRVFEIILFMLPMVISAQTKPTVGLVLSGGGALGFAHVGALKALEEVDIYPQFVAGSSMGALVGTFYAYGMNSDELCQVIFKEQMYKSIKIFSLQTESGGLGLSSHRKVEALLNKYIPGNSFDSLKRHLAVSVTNLNVPEAKLVSMGGNLKEYVMASMSIPTVFDAVKVGDNVYVDGGMMNHMPAQAIRKRCDIVIGIDVLPLRYKESFKGIKDVAERMVFIMAQNCAKEGRAMCDYLVESEACQYYSMFDFDKFQYIYNVGYLTMKRYISEHPEMIRKIKGKSVNVNLNGDAIMKVEKKWWQFWK